MKYLVLFVVLLIGCAETPENIKKEILSLKNEVRSAEDRCNQLNLEIRLKIQQLKHEKEELAKIQVNKAIKQDTAIYILVLELSQSHFTFDIGTHMTDSMNTTEFEIAVDKRFYNKVKVGESLKKEFRGGSFIMKGSIGDWNVEVKDKKIMAP